MSNTNHHAATMIVADGITDKIAQNTVQNAFIRGGSRNLNRAISDEVYSTSH
jgi:hypothetical protein